MDSPSPSPATHEPGRRSSGPASAGAARLRRLRAVGVVLPVAFVVGLQLLRPVVFDRLWPETGDAVVSALTALAAVCFGLVVFRLVDRLVEDDRLRSTLDERDRIARELHDSLAQVLGATNLRLQAVRLHPGLAAQPDVRDELADIAGDCQEAYRDVREAILGLRVGPHHQDTLVGGLTGYAETFSRQSGIATRVEAQDEPQLTPTREVQVIRVVQEALTNARKHSGASSARIVVGQEGEWATFLVEDDGVGFTPDPVASRDGFGLHSMRERAELVGGRLDIDTAPGRGTRVLVSVPAGTRPRTLARTGGAR